MKCKSKVYFESLVVLVDEDWEHFEYLVKQLSQMKGNIKIIIKTKKYISYELSVQDLAKIRKDDLEGESEPKNFKFSKVLIDSWQSPFFQTDFMIKYMDFFVPSDCSFALK